MHAPLPAAAQARPPVTKPKATAKAKAPVKKKATPARPKPDTTKARADSLKAKGDTTRARKDSTAKRTAPAVTPKVTPGVAPKAAAKPPAPAKAIVPADTLKQGAADSLKARGDSTRKATADSARAPGDSAAARPPADTLRPEVADSIKKAKALSDSLDKVYADSLRTDSLYREDLAIIAAQKKRADSIKAPIAGPEMPVLAEHPGVMRWNRDQLAATGALTLGDLLEGIPGLTVLHTGWIQSPEQGAYLGDFSAIRVFQDGVEVDAIDPRNGGALDLSFIQLWELEEVRIERGASEVRVHLRTWRVRSVTPATRVDIGTGDMSTNGYRGYFGRRYSAGQALQLGAYQYSTRDPRGIGDGDQLSIFARVGWAMKGFSVDGTLLRTRRERTTQGRTKSSGRLNLPPIDATFTDAWARVAYSDTSRGWWAQLTAAAPKLRETGVLEDQSTVGGGSSSTTKDTTAVTIKRPQYIGALGWSRGPLSLSATTRLREIEKEQKVSTMLRGSFDTPRLTIAGTAEQRAEAGYKRVEASARLQPLGFLALSGAVSRTALDDTTLKGKPLAFRGEGALRYRRMWVGGGMLSRDLTRLIAPIVYDTAFQGVADPSTTGLFVTARGKFWKDVGVDVSAIKWDGERGYRPTYQAHSRLYIDTSWPSRFPSGNLNILFAVTHDYRTQVPFLLDKGVILRSAQFRTLGLQLEIKLMQATLSYQFRNLLNEIYDEVPGFITPRPRQFYGVRWNFFN